MSLPTLAQLADVQGRAGYTFNDAQTAQAELLLVDASASIRAYCRQQLTLSQTTVVLIVNSDGSVRLPEKPIVSVDAVAVVLPNNSVSVVVDWWFDGVDMISAYWGSAVLVNSPVIWEDQQTDTIQVIYTHGYQTVPDEIVAVCCQAVLRKMSQPSLTGLQSQTIGSTSSTWTAQTSPGSMYLTVDEKADLSAHARRTGSIRLG